jgi:Transposase DDE domain
MKLIPHELRPIELIRRKVHNFIRFFQLDTHTKKVGRPLSLSLELSVAFGLFKQKHGVATKKAVYDMFQHALSCTYKTFVASINRFAWVAVLILSFVLKYNRSQQHPIKHIDSTILPVCLLRNAKHHKTMKGIAAFGRSSTGSFFGLKLHVISDLLGKLQSILFTPGNTSDKNTDVVLKLAENIWGLLIGDAGYVSKKLADAFNRADRIFMAKPYKNMRKIATRLQGLLYGTRMLIEKHFRVLKLFYGLVTSVPRSVNGYFANYFYALCAYVLA